MAHGAHWRSLLAVGVPRISPVPALHVPHAWHDVERMLAGDHDPASQGRHVRSELNVAGALSYSPLFVHAVFAAHTRFAVALGGLVSWCSVSQSSMMAQTRLVSTDGAVSS
jgi:hypothetical protein